MRACVLWVALIGCSGDGSTTDTDGLPQTGDTASSVDTDTPPELDGAALFSTNCAICHGPDGLGTIAGPDLSSELSRSDAQLIDIMQNGEGSMPPTTVDDDEAQAIVDWLRANL